MWPATQDPTRDGQIESVTWNPTTGCDRVSTGCDHCYALSFAARLKAMGNPRGQRDGPTDSSGPGFALTLHQDKVDLPLRWDRPRLVFVDSMSDLFHAQVPDSFIRTVLSTIACAHWHTFFILTKRPGRMASFLGRQETALPNVWWGTSVEDDAHTWHAAKLREAPAAIRFLSLQPLLGPVPNLSRSGIDWVYVGGESGPGHRPMQGSWVRDIRDRCQREGVPFLFKQWGGRTRNAGGVFWTGERGMRCQFSCVYVSLFE